MKIKILQRLIDIIRNKNKLPDLYILPKLVDKIYTYNEIQNEVNTIAIGSSHAEFGYIAKKGQMNLGLSFQDLYYSYKIYEKFNNSNLKNIILFYSVFSPGYQLIKTKDAFLSIAFKIICNIPYQDMYTPKNFKNLEEKYLKKYNKEIKNFQYKTGYYGNEEIYHTSYMNIPPEKRAIPHYKNNQRHNNQTKYAINIAKLAQKNNQNFYIVIPPAREDYKNLLPPSKELFKEIYEASKQISNISIINCYDDFFANDEFIDCDHLNKKGAIKLTEKINNHIYKGNNDK